MASSTISRTTGGVVGMCLTFPVGPRKSAPKYFQQMKDLVAAGTLTVVAARYDLDDGTIKQLP